VSLAATACWAGPAANNIGQSLSAVPAAQIDLSKGEALKEGYGRLVVKLEGLETSAGRRVQAAAASQSAVVVLTRPGGGQVQDQQATPHDAVYFATVSGSSTTISLPGLPPTVASPTIDPNNPSSNAYVVTTLVGDWGAFEGLNATNITDVTYAELGDAANNFDYGTSSGGVFTWDNFGADVVLSTAAGVGSNGTLLKSGTAKVDVAAGVVSTITVTNFDHLTRRFTNNAAAGNAITKGFKNVVSVSASVPAGGGSIRLRHPAWNKTDIDTSGGLNSVRYVLDLSTDATPKTWSDGTVTASFGQRNMQTGNATAVTPGAFSTTFSGTTNSGLSSGTSGLSNRLNWLDVDYTGIGAGDNVMDHTFTFSSGLGGETVRIYMLPLGATNIMSGPFTSTVFQ
jgi:hypothetical protein